MKSRMRWRVHTACMAEIRDAHKILLGKPERKSPPQKDLGIDGGIILKWILKTQNVRVWNKFNWFGVESNSRLLQ
jgi:hypothetical protein